MQTITKAEFGLNKEEIYDKIMNGSLFIHPTDTIYGIGCNALNSKAVQKVREAKNRHKQPFSVIAPSKDWIYENCVIDNKADEWIKKLPGPYTLILKLKNGNCISKEVTMGLNSIGVRIPDHWFTKAVADLGVPIVTTSANIVGKDFMTSLDNLDSKIKIKMDFIIYEGKKKGRPSKIVHLEGAETIIKER
jgi:tRNA threonylcarbamoyl adenosine modification protein (Sua5/YciO/YrdC/YwlC family)